MRMKSHGPTQMLGSVSSILSEHWIKKQVLVLLVISVMAGDPAAYAGKKTALLAAGVAALAITANGATAQDAAQDPAPLVPAESLEQAPVARVQMNTWGWTKAPVGSTTGAPVTPTTRTPTSLRTKEPSTPCPEPEKPTSKPTTPKPTLEPTTAKPTTPKPTLEPTTAAPVKSPTYKPTLEPTTGKPTTPKPTLEPTTGKPTTPKPTLEPTTGKPTTAKPTVMPTKRPTRKPTRRVTQVPTPFSPPDCEGGGNTTVVDTSCPAVKKQDCPGAVCNFIQTLPLVVTCNSGVCSALSAEEVAAGYRVSFKPADIQKANEMLKGGLFDTSYPVVDAKGKIVAVGCNAKVAGATALGNAESCLGTLADNFLFGSYKVAKGWSDNTALSFFENQGSDLKNAACIRTTSESKLTDLAPQNVNNGPFPKATFASFLPNWSGDGGVFKSFDYDTYPIQASGFEIAADEEWISPVFDFRQGNFVAVNIQLVNGTTCTPELNRTIATIWAQSNTTATLVKKITLGNYLENNPNHLYKRFEIPGLVKPGALKSARQLVVHAESDILHVTVGYPFVYKAKK